MNSYKIKEKVCPHSVALATSYTNIGLVHRAKGELNIALEYFEKTLLLEEQLDKNSDALITTYKQIAAVYDELNVYNSAILYFNKALVLCHKMYPDGIPVAICYNLLGEINLKDKQYKDALILFKKSMNICEILAPDNDLMAQTHSYYAEALVSVGRPSEAHEHSMLANQIRENCQHQQKQQQKQELNNCSIQEQMSIDGIGYNGSTSGSRKHQDHKINIYSGKTDRNALDIHHSYQ